MVKRLNTTCHRVEFMQGEEVSQMLDLTALGKMACVCHSVHLATKIKSMFPLLDALGVGKTSSLSYKHN